MRLSGPLCFAVLHPRVLRKALFAANVMEFPEVERLVTVSDVHVDDESNMQWIENLKEKKNEALILAGDVSDRLDRLERTFRVLKEKYAAVFYTPGNHDVWLRESEGYEDSFEKLDAVLQLARQCGVGTGVGILGREKRCVVAPLLAWYHASFDTEPKITMWRGIPAARMVMTDYRRCKWPDGADGRGEVIAKAMDDRNDEIESQLRDIRGDDDDLVTFSHFLPRIELVPEKRFLFLPTLTEAIGSRYLGDRVQRIRPNVHVFGHTHINWDSEIDGVRYIQAALAYSQEWRTRPASLEIGDLVRDDRSPVLLWDFNDGIVDRPYSTRWSDHYKRFPRVPDLTHILPPYTARLYKPLPGSDVKEVQDHVPPFDSSSVPVVTTAPPVNHRVPL